MTLPRVGRFSLNEPGQPDLGFAYLATSGESPGQVPRRNSMAGREAPAVLRVSLPVTGLSVAEPPKSGTGTPCDLAPDAEVTPATQ